MLNPVSNSYKAPPQTHPIAPKPLQSPLSPQKPQGDSQNDNPQDNLSLSSSRNRELQVYWKKQIKNYIRAWRKRNSRRWPKLLKNQLSNAFVLLGDRSITRKTNVIKQHNTFYKQKTSCLCTLSPPKKSKDPTCLIVSPHAFHGLKTEFMFELTAINQHGKIVYNAICLKSWGDLQKELAYIEKHLTVVAALLQDKLQFMSIVPSKEFELKRFFDDLTDLGEIISNSQTALQSDSNCLQNQNNSLEDKPHFSDLKSFAAGLKLFVVIKKRLYENLALAEKLSTGVRLWEYFSLAYNVSWPLFKLNSASLQDLVLPFQPILRKIVDKAAEKEASQPEQRSKLDHYPTYLQNAHRCWSCKHKRGYIACLCCSMTEGKTVSLCLNCYGPYHYANKMEFSNNLALPLLYKWQQIGAFADFVVGVERDVPQYPSDFQLKKQENL